MVSERTDHLYSTFPRMLLVSTRISAQARAVMAVLVLRRLFATTLHESFQRTNRMHTPLISHSALSLPQLEPKSLEASVLSSPKAPTSCSERPEHQTHDTSRETLCSCAACKLTMETESRNGFAKPTAGWPSMMAAATLGYRTLLGGRVESVKLSDALL